MNYIGTELRGKTLLSIGYGNIGKSVIKLANALGMKTQYANSQTSDNDIEKMITNADIIVLCYPLNDKTKGSFNGKRIEKMKSTAILINVARGLLVDYDVLFLSLKENRILGAGLDVFPKDETLTSGRSDIMDFAKLPNVVATSHIAFNTFETKERFGTELINNINSILSGNPINLVN